MPSNYLEEINGELVIKGEFLDKLATLKKQKEDADKELKELTGNITKELSTHFNDTQKVGSYNYVVKGGTYTYEFDEDLFRVENPQLYIRYCKPSYTKESTMLVSALRTQKGE